MENELTCSEWVMASLVVAKFVGLAVLIWAKVRGRSKRAARRQSPARA